MGLFGGASTKSLTLATPKKRAMPQILREGECGRGHCQDLAPLGMSAVLELWVAGTGCAHMKLQAHCKMRLDRAASWACCSEAG